MSPLRTLIPLLFALCVPAAASAVTVRDIIELTRAGLPDEVLVAVIDADRTIFTLDKEQILELKKAGVSKAVLIKMIRSRREFEASVAVVAPTAPVAPVAPDTPTPGLVVIGVESKPQPEPPTPQYYYVPYPIWGTRAPRGPRPVPQPFMSGDRGFGRFINDGWIGPR
jgi:hypothetical protein